MDYTNFDVEDFVDDTYFRRWVLRPDTTSEQFWYNWQQQHPDKAKVIAQARQIVTSIPVVRYQLPQSDRTQIWNQIQNVTATPSNSHSLYRSTYLRWAAAIALLIVTTVALLVWQSSHSNQLYYTTTYGEQQVVTLPDSSIVILNANSSLRLPDGGFEHEIRELWLEGEAFFRVRKEIGNPSISDTALRKFIVHTADADVEVLGTEFNVRSRDDITQVVLNSGKVKVNIARDSIMMKPGDLVEVDLEKQEVVQRMVDPKVHSAWKENKLICNGMPVEEIAEMLRDTYGLHIVFADTSLASTRVYGTFPTENIDVFLLLLAESTEATLRRKDNQVVLE
ncbi:FecR family protein [Tunicatimonas pelagia]|uniref:FecR family protein n=1 Tax=Tunicatimonas pelagia TaxID=931531 RepID=UPI002666376A|nr:FecR domain-containing protein [Tunicatimonas pelagia]WKN44216.1 FecR domain-containing protein [Tunicatimonas pelagia]